MEFRPCPAPYSRYEISSDGLVRSYRNGKPRACLTPRMYRGSYTYSLHRDNGRSATVHINKLMSKVWPEVSFRASWGWYQDLRPSPKKRKALPKRMASSALPSAWNLDAGGTIDWRDANYCPMG